MASKNHSSDLQRPFTLLMRRTLWPGFRFPGGGAAERAVEGCVKALQCTYGVLSDERIADFCICQAYVISGYGEEYRRRWQPAHSFGTKALERFERTTPARRYYEDRWLHGYGLSREGLAAEAGCGEHPLARFVFPVWEESTKRRLLSTEAGYLICGSSTLLWTPQSPACVKCRSNVRCRERTQHLYPELYRLRCEVSRKHE